MPKRLVYIMSLVLLLVSVQVANCAEVLSLGRAFSYTEKPEGKANQPIDTSIHLPSVDYKSQIEILPDQSTLKSLASTNQNILPNRSDEMNERISSVQDLIQAATQYVEDAKAINNEVRTAKQSGQDLSPERMKALQGKIREQATSGLILVETVERVARAKARAKFGEDADKVDQEVIDKTESLFLSADKKNDVILNVKEFARFLSEEISFVSQASREDTAIASTQGAAQLRMIARINLQDKEPVAVRIDPYYSVETLEGPKRPRVSFRMSERDQARVQEGFELATEGARLVNDVRNERSDLRKGLAQLERTARDELKKFDEDLLENLENILKNEVTEIERSLDVDQKKSLDNFSAFLANAKTLRADAVKILAGFKNLKQAGKQSPTALLSIYMAVPADVNDAVKRALGFAKMVETAAEDVTTLTNALKTPGMINGITNSLKNEMLNGLTKTQGIFETFLTNQKTTYPKLAKSLSDLISRYQVIGMAKGFNISNVDTNIHALALDHVVPGTIDLNRTPADRGDEIEIRMELIAVDESGTVKVIHSAAQSFRVGRFGITSEFSAHLIFVERLGSGRPADPKADFDPAPSASWTIHYRLPRKPTMGGWEKAYSFIDPGIGINTSAIDFEDESFQLGVGTHLSVFDNLIILGYGYNLQANSDPHYAYFGIGILEAMDTLGGFFR